MPGIQLLFLGSQKSLVNCDWLYVRVRDGLRRKNRLLLRILKNPNWPDYNAGHLSVSISSSNSRKAITGELLISQV